MNKKLIGICFGFVCSAMCLSGCGSSSLSEKEIIASLPEYMTEIYVDSQLYELEIDDFEIKKRKTEEDIDEVYFTVHMSCDDYKISREGYLEYIYYDEGGWILENCMEDIGEFEPLTGVSQFETDIEMEYYYFDTFSFVEHTFDEDTNTSYSVYDVTYDCENYSYDGQVTMVSTFTENGTYSGGVWNKSLVHNDVFDWKIEGNWAAEPSDFSDGRSFRRTAFEINVSSVDQAAGTISFSATEYDCGLTDGEVDMDSVKNVNANILVDYSGTEYLAYIKPVFDEEATEAAKYKAPTLSFEFNIGDHQSIIKFDTSGASIHLGGYGGASGKLYQGFGITTWNNAEFGYVEMGKQGV